MNAVVGADGMHAGWIESSAGDLFACYHPPAGTRRRGAVLLCDPFGSDRMNLHLAYRTLSLKLAAAGFFALRVDYPGTCDSSGYPRDRDQLESWLQALDDAASWLRARSGVESLGLFGALLGGTLAVLLAQRRDDIDMLVLCGAYVRGSVLLRELEAFQAMSAANPEGLRAEGFQKGDREGIGFVLTRQTVESIAAIDLGQLATRPARRAVLLPRGTGGKHGALREALQGAGVEVRVMPEVVAEIADLHDERAAPPPALIAQWMRPWLEEHPERVTPAGPVASEGLRASVTLKAPDATPVREELVRFGRDAGLIGIVSRPDGGAPAGRAVVLVNGGGNHRPGINRNHTEWARAWAARGRLVLRMDVRGLGDSVPRQGEGLAALYRDGAQRDVRDAIGFLQQRYGVRGVLCGGLCAGAYHALHTALADKRVHGLFMLNPLRFERDESAPSQGRTERWRRRLAEDIRFGRAGRSIVKRLGQRLGPPVRFVASRFGLDAVARGPWLARAMRELTARGCHVLLVFNRGEPMREYFDAALGDERQRLVERGNFRVELVEPADHIFTPLCSQQRVAALLADFVERAA